MRYLSIAALLLCFSSLCPAQRIDCLDELTFPPAYGGLSQETYDQIQFWATRGIMVEDDVSNNRSEINFPSRQMFPLTSVLSWTSLASHVYDYDCYFELSDPDQPCPFSGDDPQQTWREWGVADNGSHAPIFIPDDPADLEGSGRWFRSNKYGNAGERVPATQDTTQVLADWGGWILNPDTVNTAVVQVLTVEEFQAISTGQQMPTSHTMRLKTLERLRVKIE